MQIIITVWAFVILVMTLSLTKSMWMNFFNLVNKNSLIKSTESYEKLNRIMLEADVSLSVYHYKDEDSLSASYKNSDSETVVIRANGTNIDRIINDTYALSLQKGLIQE